MGVARAQVASNGRVRVLTNGINLENATSTNSRFYEITNASGTTGWAFGNGIIASAHQFVIYDNTAGTGGVLIDGNGISRFNNGIQLGNGLSNSTANQLTDYEEGTFSPSFKAQNASGNSNTTVQESKYIKVGAKVFFNFFIDMNTHHSSSTGGLAFITGLPFQSIGNHFPISIGYWNNFIQAQRFVTGTVQPSSTDILLRHTTSG